MLCFFYEQKMLFKNGIKSKKEVCMNFAGFYPFNVSVWNFFAPDSGIQLKVTFTHHKCYFDEKNDFKAEHIPIGPDGQPLGKDYMIEPGTSLAFPMYFGDETLILSIAPGHAPTSDYQLTAGDTAECYQTGLGDPEDGSSGGRKEIKGKTYWMGGTWAIAPGKTAWQMEIIKVIPDPQSDDVTVGPGTPG